MRLILRPAGAIATRTPNLAGEHKRNRFAKTIDAPRCRRRRGAACQGCGRADMSTRNQAACGIVSAMNQSKEAGWEGCLLWAVGVPIPVIIVLNLIFGH
jgi:hypothetical protein